MAKDHKKPGTCPHNELIACRERERDPERCARCAWQPETDRRIRAERVASALRNADREEARHGVPL